MPTKLNWALSQISRPQLAARIFKKPPSLIFRFKRSLRLICIAVTKSDNITQTGLSPIADEAITMIQSLYVIEKKLVVNHRMNDNTCERPDLCNKPSKRTNYRQTNLSHFVRIIKILETQC
ncbi:hypothetical protein WH43_07970 [Rheinheimera sp. KL1]|nr:hypothetical protein WH43_07970 [Rheinheimera sp. KL1]